MCFWIDYNIPAVCAINLAIKKLLSRCFIGEFLVVFH
jgi:hypothetical protein